MVRGAGEALQGAYLVDGGHVSAGNGSNLAQGTRSARRSASWGDGRALSIDRKGGVPSRSHWRRYTRQMAGGGRRTIAHCLDLSRKYVRVEVALDCEQHGIQLRSETPNTSFRTTTPELAKHSLIQNSIHTVLFDSQQSISYTRRHRGPKRAKVCKCMRTRTCVRIFWRL